MMGLLTLLAPALLEVKVFVVAVISRSRTTPLPRWCRMGGRDDMELVDVDGAEVGAGGRVDQAGGRMLGGANPN